MKSRIYSLLLGALLLASCDKFEESQAPDFEVTTQQASYKVGQPVNFQFQGQADMISFYSGQALNDYAFKEGRVIDATGAGATLSFSTSLQGTGTQKNTFKVLASTDFNGKYDDLASVKAATWTDITSRFTLSPGTSTAFTASGQQDISDLLVPGKPIYIAFQYHNKPQQANGLARQWMVQTFAVKSSKTLEDKALTLADQMNAGFVLVDQYKDQAPARSLVTSTRITLYANIYKDPASPLYDPNNPIYHQDSAEYDPNAVYVPYDPASPYNDPESENWAISKPIYTQTIDLGPDRAVAVKGMETQPDSYVFTYDTPGTYKAYFVAANANIAGSRQVVRSVDITIDP
jgi:hypothetical protein